MRRASALLDAALGYARRGWRVIPLHTPTGDPDCPCTCKRRAEHQGGICTTPGKHPRLQGWPERATTDETQIREWWAWWPDANVGIATGKGSGFWALDIDGEAGLEALRKLEEANSPLPATPEQITGGNGYHRLFQYAASVGNKVGFAPHLDTRSDGGLIVAEPSLHESGREYAWNLDAHPDDLEIAAAPGWLLTAIRKGAGVGSGGPAAAPPVGKTVALGARNATLASMAGTMRRRGADVEEIEPALQRMNRRRCSPPLPESEVHDIAASIGRYPAATGPNGAAAPLNSLNSQGEGTASRSERGLDSLNSLDSQSEWPADLAPEAFHGIAGEIVQALAPETEADPAALLLNMLIAFGNAAGRAPHWLHLTTRHGCNLFGALVGPTGEGSKGSSWDPILWLFHRALPTYVEQHVGGGLASGEGLIALVRDRREKRQPVKDKKSGRPTGEMETVIEDEGVEDKRWLAVEAEMTALLKIMNRPGNILSEQLRQAWDKGDLQNLSKGAPMRATGAHISLLGHITPDALRQHLTAADAANGFGNRFLWMLCRRSQYLPEGGTLPYLNNYITYIRELVELASDKIMPFAREAGAKAMWAAVYEDLRRPGVGMFGELTARRAPIVGRLSVIYALLDGLSVVLPEHLLAALAVWERSEASVRFLFGDATGDPVADALYEALLARPEGARRTDLHQALGRHRSAADIDRGLAALSQGGKARMVRQKGDGEREGEFWFAQAAPTQIAASAPYLSKAKAALAALD